jgi:hypothetical protein
MSDQTRTSHPIYNLLPTEIQGFDALAELALDMHWSCLTQHELHAEIGGAREGGIRVIALEPGRGIDSLPGMRR